jgi:predicted phage tail protein
MTMREDFNVDYQGKKANKVTLNMDMGAGDSAMNIISYMDASTGASLGGHMQMTAGGQVLMDQDIEPGASATATPGGVSTENPLLSFQGTSMANSGTESVTVPAGTYVATKYTWGSGGNTGTVWVAPNVPVPVKMSYASASSTTNMELTGWG